MKAAPMTSAVFPRCRFGARRRIARAIRVLPGDRSGLALVEFAMSFPLLLLMATSGLELANYVITMKRIGEIAGQVADNASRMGSQAVINDQPVSEAEINDVFIGADLQGGKLNLGRNGRIILSSLQRNSDGGQMIQWQRCFGALNQASAYGVEKTGATGTNFTGMGPTNNQVAAADKTAVMVVEINYQYQRIIPLIQLPLSMIRDVTAFNVRDSRNLSDPQNSENVAKSTCPTAA